MTGIVDGNGCTLLRVRVKHPTTMTETEVDDWIDTGFTGDLVAPLDLIKSLGLPRGSAIQAILADGKEIVLDAYSCQIEWFGETKAIEVIANDGKYPLLGYGLLINRKLNIDYQKQSLNLD